MKLRVSLASAQVINYATLSLSDTAGWIALVGGLPTSSSTLTLLHRVFQRAAKSFHPTYRKEIAKKFVQVTFGSKPQAGAVATQAEVTPWEAEADRSDFAASSAAPMAPVAQPA